MNVELFIGVIATLFVLGFLIGFKKFRIPKCIQKLFVAIIGEFAASTQEFTKNDLLKILEANPDTQEILNDKERLKRCILTIYSLLKRGKPELPDDLDKLKSMLAEAAIDLFVHRGILIDVGRGRYRVHNVLNMLTEKHYVEARSVTSNDDILYGAYQVRHITSFRAVFVEFLPLVLAFIIAVIFPRLAILHPGSIFERVIDKLNPRGVNQALRSLFVLSIGILLKDVIDNAVKAYFREKYRVVVGRKSGIRYDLTYDDRLSGNIRRWLVARSNVDLEQNFWQRVFSRFSSVPVGDIKIRMPAKDAVRSENPGLIDEAIYTIVDCIRDLNIKEPIQGEVAKKVLECAKKKSRKARELTLKDVERIFEERPRYIIRHFRNMPYPNEMYKAIRALQLGHIHRRMKHADKILMRKGGAVASIDTRRRR